jgi:excisionase family DNA binding protein
MSLKLFTLDEIAELMQVSRRHVQRLVSSGRLRAVSIGTRMQRVRECDFLAMLESSTASVELPTPVRSSTPAPRGRAGIPPASWAKRR